MSDDDHPVPDDELVALLRSVSGDMTLQPQHRDRARAAMLAEFDSHVVETPQTGVREHLSVAPKIEVEGECRRRRRRSRVSGWSAAAAACLVVLTLAVLANVRDVPNTSDAPNATVPRPPPTLPPVEEPARLLTATSLLEELDDGRYRTNEIRDGVELSGAAGLQPVALRPGLLALDSVSSSGDLIARISVFEADSTAVASVLDNAVADGDLQVSTAQFTGAERSLRRQDLTVTSEGVIDLECAAQNGCLPLVVGVDEFDPSIWARSENFLVEISPGETDVYVFVQTTSFGDPLLGQAFEIIDSLRFD